ncbi:MAG: PAS domain-containing sensor histidine kinase [Thermobacillus sp. ZCTH02-B1]|uniref:ATP-binding protein n=1 Tax=Thermobacillus sp. ZCTH02-B1 TaxID=1858795 RepID=UPI000B55F26C|nr:ATP-binding protein [Thermobacillus sp. ZCTH02-B1]OUM95357.1 MAG: PAS domain-containing sensor histidine kinase [Thermobacillus sp. ZCTH02-B1]
MLMTSRRYFPALAAYLRAESPVSLQCAVELGRTLAGMRPEEIVAMHHEAVQMLAANAEPEEALDLYDRSFTFLIEIMAAFRDRMPDSGPTLNWYAEMKEKLNRSQRSFVDIKNKYESVLQHMDSGIALFDGEGTLSFVNLQMARLLDVPRNALAGCTLRHLLFHPRLKKPVRRMILRVLKEMALKRSRYFELQDAQGRHLLVTVTYGDRLDGHYLVSVKDVSEFKQIEQTAYQNDKLAMLGKIAASIAHEIRNPLTSIRGFIQLLRPHLMKLGKEEYARIILDEIDRANDIIYEFLNSSKPTAPMAQIVTVETLLKEVMLLSESEAIMRGCQINLEAYDPQAKVSIDVKQIKQVMLNIVKNALDAITELGGERNGRIDIVARKEGSFVVIAVRDNGKGMDQATMSRLFDPFFTTKEQGTGLGLSVSYRIIRNHGGMIRVSSQPGEGTEFKIYLPSAD